MAQRTLLTFTDYDTTRIVERPDGFYWQAKDSEDEHGPFATLGEALEDMEFGVDPEPEAPELESLEQVEAEFGVAWIDPDTGEPTENGAPRIEDH